MRLRMILAGTALGALMIGGVPLPGASSLVPQAEAAVDVSIGVFYDQIAQYGDWVSYRGGYVFIPGRVGPGWRPYTLGHWVYTNRYGWTWASDEPFGWATYHYGRWGYGDDIGWYWVPGNRWAPAWVSWRRSNDYVVWAPLPPSRRGGSDISINITVGDIPDYYWVAVPTRRFLAPDLRADIVHDDREARRVVRETRFLGTPRVNSDIVVNNVIDVDVISRETGKRVRPVEVRRTDNPVEARAGAGEVTVFEGKLSTDTKDRPQKLSDVSRIKKIKRVDKANATGATAPADTGATPAVAQPPASGAAATTPAESDTTTNAKDNVQPAGKKKMQDQNASTPDVSSQKPAKQVQDQQTGKKRKKTTGNAASSPDAMGQQPATQAQDQPTGKRKKKQPAMDDTSTGSTTPAPDLTKGNGNPRKNKASQPAQDGNANAPASDNGQGKRQKNQVPCDAATDPSCAPAQ
ncbi:MAG: DUF6600 domain-containing protein [Hyphomicrobiales bacterium]